MRKDPNWIGQFYKACAEQKINSTTCYEFSIRSQVYECTPLFKKALCQKNTIRLYFDKRIADTCGTLFTGRSITGADGTIYQVKKARVDGNILELKLDKSPRSQTDLRIPLGGICDDPSLRYVTKDLPSGKLNVIPDGAEQVVRID
jgi:hypothetical protein